MLDPVEIVQKSVDELRDQVDLIVLLTFERGLLQLSGLELSYDLMRPEGQRIVSLTQNGRPVMAEDQFTIAAPGFLTQGGDLYDSFAESAAIGSAGKVSDVVIQYFGSQEVVSAPKRGRQKDVTPPN